jgi:hypothetical protein
MKIEKFVTATTDNNLYYQFCGFASQNMKNKFGQNCEIVIAYITDRDESDERYKRICEFATVVKIDPIPELEIGIQAKVSRLWLASQSDSPCAIIDVDWFALNEDFFLNCFDNCKEGTLGVIGSNVFSGTRDEGKFPMNMVHGHNETFRKIINPKNLQYRDLLLSWDCNRFDGKENVFNRFNGFSDESLLRKLVHDCGMENQITHNHMPSHRPYGFSSRIDRSNWNFDLEKMRSGYYIDSQPLRPINDNLGAISPLLEYLNLEVDKFYIK